MSRLLGLCLGFAIFCQGLSAMSSPIKIARTSKENFHREITNYADKKKKENTKKWMKRGAMLGAGALGVGALGLVGFTLNGAVRSSMVRETSNEERDWGEFLKQGMTWAIIGGIGSVFLQSAGQVGAYIYSQMISGNRHIFLALLPYAKRIENSVIRLQESIQELDDCEKGSFLFNHYLFETTDAYLLFVRSLEKFGASLLHELKASYGENDLVVKNSYNSIQRLFLFADHVAEKIELQLNANTWSGFSKETMKLVDALRIESFALLPQGPKGEES